MVDGPDGEERLAATSVISSMPISELLRAMDPPAPADVQAAADALRHRDFLTVALVVPESVAFPDNWIYVHEPEVKLGRIQNFGSWSPYMVQDGRTCLGLEYFVNQGDELWDLPDEQLVELGQATSCSRSAWSTGAWSRPATSCACRRPTRCTTPPTPATSTSCGPGWRSMPPTSTPSGATACTSYNNQDHSMYTAMLTVENILKGTEPRHLGRERRAGVPRGADRRPERRHQRRSGRVRHRPRRSRHRLR